MNTNSTMNAGKKPDDKKAKSSAETAAHPEACARTHDGTVVSITGNKLVMSSHDGKECSHTVASDAKVTCDDVECRTEDLKAGARIRLTTKHDDKSKAIKIEALKKHTEFAKAC
jgi:hypothetical protein